jgi:hypothetical protein
MNPDTQADLPVSTAETIEESKVVETTEDKPQEPLQDPIKKELEKVENKSKGRTELEKAIFTKKQIEKRIAELGGESGTPTVDDDAPVTVGMLKKLEQEKASKTAQTLAEEQIEDEHELELTKYHLTNTIKSSGNAEEDLKIARAIVNTVKNSMIVDEVARKTSPKRTSAGSSAPGKHEEAFEPTSDELAFMNMKGYDGKPLMTKDDILKARKLSK